MSETRIAAVVCEGQTDVPILRSIIQTLWSLFLSPRAGLCMVRHPP
jgi:hypothetical protein